MILKKTLILLTFFVAVSASNAQYYDPYNYYGYNNNYGNFQTYYLDNSYNYTQPYYQYPNLSVNTCYDYYGNYTCSNNYNYNNNSYYNYNYTNYASLNATTYAATNVSSSYGTINGYVSNSNNYNTNSVWGTAYFQYGTSPSNLSVSTNPANIYQNTTINANLTSLTCNTTYYFRAVTSSSVGLRYGNVLSFTTSPCYDAYNYNYNYYGNYGYNTTPYLPNNVQTYCKYGKKKYSIY